MIQKLLIVFVILILLVLFLNELYFWYVCGHKQEQQIMKGKKKGPYKAIAFGSSYCRYGINFDKVEDGFNFGVAAQFFYYSDLMLREYAIKCLERGGKVYIIIAHLVFAEIGQGCYNPEKYQLILSKDSLEGEYSLSLYLKMRFPLIFRPRSIMSSIKKIIRSFLGINKNEFKNTTVNPLSETEVNAMADKRCESWCRQFGLKDTVSADIPEILQTKFTKTVAILHEMIQFCLDNSFEPILVVTPVSEIMNRHLSKQFLDAVLFDNIRKANTQGVPLLNYIDDCRFADSSLYHKNADFLNARGRKLFTEQLLKDTKEL